MEPSLDFIMRRHVTKMDFFARGGDFIRQTTPCTCFLFRVRPNALLAPLADGLGDGLGSICEKKKKKCFFSCFRFTLGLENVLRLTLPYMKTYGYRLFFFSSALPPPYLALLFSFLTLLLSSYRSSSSSFFLFPPICV